MEWITCARCRKTHGGPSFNLVRTAERGERGRPERMDAHCSEACCDAHVPDALRFEGVEAMPVPLAGGERPDACSGCGAPLAGWHTVYTVEHAGAPASVMAALCQACRPLTAEEQQDEAPA